MKSDVQDIKQFTRSVQKDLLFQIAYRLKRGVITKEYASGLSKDFLAIGPFESHDDLLEKLSSLNHKYSEVTEVYTKHAKVHYGQIRASSLKKASELLSSSRITDAITVLQSVRGGEK